MMNLTIVISECQVDCLQCFMTLSTGHQKEHPADKKCDEVLAWCGYLSGARCILFAYGPDDATATPPLTHRRFLH